MSDPLEALLIEMPPLDEIAVRQLETLVKAAEPYPWRVEKDDSEDSSQYVVVTANGDALATLPGDQYGRDHAKLMAAAPLLALRILNALKGKAR